MYTIKTPLLDKYYPWLIILAAEVFAVFPTNNRLKGYSPGQLLLGYDIILPMKHAEDWELISEKNQTQNIKYNIRENRKIVDHRY